MKMSLIVYRSFIQSTRSSFSLTTARGMLGMSRHFGGTQPIMRDTIIVDAQGYLGPHSPRLLEVDQTQSFVFKADDCGPWYLTPEQRDLQRHNKGTGRTKLVERSKKQLFNALTNAGVLFQQNRNHTKKNFKTLRGFMV